MPRQKNPFGKTVKRENAHFVYQSYDGLWTWFILRTYQTPEQEAKNPYARWLCNVTSPFTSDRGDTGDVYVREIMSVGRKLSYNPLTQDVRMTGSEEQSA